MLQHTEPSIEALKHRDNDHEAKVHFHHTMAWEFITASSREIFLNFA